MTDAQLEALRQRNAERAQKAIARLGTRWLLHPANAAKRVEPKQPVLPQK